MKRATIVLALLAFLTSCAGGGSDTKQAIRLTAPDVVQYPKQEQKEAADELEACGMRCKVLAEMMKDYAVMRNQARILKGKIWQTFH